MDELESRDDAGLVRAWRRGDGRAAETLVRRHQKTVYRLVLRSTGDPSTADDITQKVFLKALTNLEQLKGDRAFQSWLMRIALNFSRSRGRGLSRWLRAPAEALARLRSESPGQDEIIDKSRMSQRIRAAMEKLPKRQQRIVRLRLYAELPFKSIADTVGTTEASAKVTYHNAIQTLRRQVRGRA